MSSWALEHWLFDTRSRWRRQARGAQLRKNRDRYCPVRSLAHAPSPRRRTAWVVKPSANAAEVISVRSMPQVLRSKLGEAPQPAAP